MAPDSSIRSTRHAALRVTLHVLGGAALLAASACSGGTSEVPSKGAPMTSQDSDAAVSPTRLGAAADASTIGADASGEDASSASSSSVTSNDASVSQKESSDASSGTTAACVDGGACVAPNGGITFDCEKRFLFGVNYAWQNWGYDFGGGSQGVAGNSATVKTALEDMQSHGADVIRWWMFQELNGQNGVALDANGIPTGTAGGTLVTDIQTALSLAAQVGVHYNLTLFSFDNFVLGSGRNDMSPIITNSANLAKLLQVVKIVAQTVESDPNKDRVVSWDVINEPEWAIGAADGDVDGSTTGTTDGYGDQAFTPGSAGEVYDLVTFAQMQTFVAGVVTTLHQNSSALVTVGSAAVKWKGAWQHVGLDYYTVHMYDWINQYWPYTTAVSSFDFPGPLVMGEFPNQGLTGVPYATLLAGIFGPSVGYAGAMSWAYTDQSYPWTGTNGGAANVQAFAATEPCVTKF